MLFHCKGKCQPSITAALHNNNDQPHVFHSVTQHALEHVEHMSAARPASSVPPASPGQQMDGQELLVSRAVKDESPEVQSEAGVAAMTAAAVAGGRAAAAAVAEAAARSSSSDTSAVAAMAAVARADKALQRRSGGAAGKGAAAATSAGGAANEKYEDAVAEQADASGANGAAAAAGNGGGPAESRAAAGNGDERRQQPQQELFLEGHSLAESGGSGSLAPCLPAPTLLPAEHAAMQLPSAESLRRRDDVGGAGAGGRLPSVASGALPLSTVGSLVSAASELSSAGSSARSPAPPPSTVLPVLSATPEAVPASPSAAVAALPTVSSSGAGAAGPTKAAEQRKAASPPVSVPGSYRGSGASPQRMPPRRSSHEVPEAASRRLKSYDLSWAPQVC